MNGYKSDYLYRFSLFGGLLQTEPSQAEPLLAVMFLIQWKTMIVKSVKDWSPFIFAGKAH